jgi:hypothetical protein
VTQVGYENSDSVYSNVGEPFALICFVAVDEMAMAPIGACTRCYPTNISDKSSTSCEVGVCVLKHKQMKKKVLHCFTPHESW